VQATQRDESTRELLQARLSLNPDVKFWPENYGNRVWYHVESAQHGKFFRVGQAEYTLISLLDGQTNLGEAISLTPMKMLTAHANLAVYLSNCSATSMKSTRIMCRRRQLVPQS
jgi:hypothetical protein